MRRLCVCEISERSFASCFYRQTGNFLNPRQKRICWLRYNSFNRQQYSLLRTSRGRRRNAHTLHDVCSCQNSNTENKVLTTSRHTNDQTTRRRIEEIHYYSAKRRSEEKKLYEKRKDIKESTFSQKLPSRKNFYQKHRKSCVQ